jgi:putative nucleotidyltransferase-like protein
LSLIASSGLDRARTEAVPFRPADAREWNALLGRIRFERVGGLAVEAAATGALDLAEDQADELLRLHRAGMTWCLHAERKLLRLADAFDDAGIEYAVLKGPALAHTVYREPCLRPFGDLDLLVRSEDYDGASALLTRIGHARSRPEPRPGWEARFGKASVHVDPNDGIEIDLHRTLVLGPFGQWIDADALMTNLATFVVGGRTFPRLDDTGMFLNVVLHAALGWAHPRIAPIRDCYELAALASLDEGRLKRWVSSWRLGAAFERARSLVATQLGVKPPRVFDLGSMATREDRRLLANYSLETRALALQLTTMRALPGIAAKAQYVWGLAVPDRAFLQARAGLGSPSRLRRVTLPLSSWLSTRVGGRT